MPDIINVKYNQPFDYKLLKTIYNMRFITISVFAGTVNTGENGKRIAAPNKSHQDSSFKPS